MTKFVCIVTAVASIAYASAVAKDCPMHRATIELIGTKWTWIEYTDRAGNYTETSVSTDDLPEGCHVDDLVIYDSSTGEIIK